MEISDSIEIRNFQPSDQAEVKALVLAGLVDHWGVLDPTKNPDLNDIAASYAGATFLVARCDGRLVGSGALVGLPAPEGVAVSGGGVAEIVRMSVARDLRRLGLGRQLVARLLEAARAAGYRRVVLETTETWSEVIAFYLSLGFVITHHQDGDTYFAIEL